MGHNYLGHNCLGLDLRLRWREGAAHRWDHEHGSAACLVLLAHSSQRRRGRKAWPGMRQTRGERGMSYNHGILLVMAQVGTAQVGMRQLGRAWHVLQPRDPALHSGVAARPDGRTRLCEPRRRPPCCGCAQPDQHRGRPYRCTARVWRYEGWVGGRSAARA